MNGRVDRRINVLFLFSSLMLLLSFQIKLQRSSSSSKFIGPKDHLSGSWNVHDDESDIDFSEYCVGTTVGECQVQEMRRVSGNQTTITCFDCKLKHRQTHFMTIRVWNKAGLFSLATTQGITADLSPPSSGHVVPDSLFLPCVNRCTLAGTFNGFKDDESGIKRCEFVVQNTNGSKMNPIKQTTGENRAVANDIQLEHNEMYQIVVNCINNLGETSIGAYSSPVIIDNTPPEKVSWKKVVICMLTLTQTEKVFLGPCRREIEPATF